MNGAGDGFLVDGDLSEGGIPLGGGAGDVKCVAASAFEGGFGDSEGAGLVFGVFAGDGELGLGTSEFEVGEGGLGGEGEKEGVEIGLKDIGGGAGGFDGVTDPTEEIEFPSGIETGADEFEVAATEGGTEGGGAIAEVFVAGSGGDGGSVVEASLTPEGAGFLEAGLADGEVFVGGGGLVDEAVQGGVVQLAPPSGGEGVDFEGIGTGGEVGGEVGGGLFEAWADGAGGEEDEEKEAGTHG